jgi:hypothetical protein
MDCPFRAYETSRLGVRGKSGNTLEAESKDSKFSSVVSYELEMFKMFKIQYI